MNELKTIFCVRNVDQNVKFVKYTTFMKYVYTIPWLKNSDRQCVYNPKSIILHENLIFVFCEAPYSHGDLVSKLDARFIT